MEFSYKVEAQYVGAASGAIVSQPTLSATNSSYAPTTFTATPPTVSNATFYSRQWYKDGVEIPMHRSDILCNRDWYIQVRRNMGRRKIEIF